MLELGHPVTIFCHGNIKGVPEGVEICDAREITGNRSVLLHAKTQSPALFADQFRYHMIRKLGYIWVDLDFFLIKPLWPIDDYLFAYEDKIYINGAILSLPKSSPTLMDLITFCENEYPVPPFFSFFQDKKVKILFQKMIGKPVHVTHMKWGVWGPRALTWFLIKNQEDYRAKNSHLFYPVHWRNIDQFFLSSNLFKSTYLNKAVAVHLYGMKLRKLIDDNGGVEKIPTGSYLNDLFKYGS